MADNIFDLEWIDKYIKRPPKVFMEIGAAYAAIAVMVKKRYPSCRVIAVEPSPVFKKHLSKINKAYGIEYYDTALGGCSKKVKFFQSYGKAYTYSSIYSPNKTLIKKKRGDLKFSTYKVKMTTLPELCIKNNIDFKDVDILHMDVHGAELPILKTMDPIKPKLLFVETGCFNMYAVDYTKSAVDDYLKNLGYSIEKELKRDTLYVLKD